jgi:uncharacterized protein YoxC
MRKPLALILIIFSIFVLGCQKDYYLDDLNEAKATFELLNKRLNQINSQNRLLISENQQLALLVNNLQDQIESSSISIVSALSQIEDIEEHILSLEQKIAETSDDIELRTLELLGKLENEFPEQTDLKVRIDALLVQLDQEMLSDQEANVLYRDIAYDFAVFIGVQDGFYRTDKVSYPIEEEDFQNQDFELQYNMYVNYYYEIKDKNIVEVSTVRNDDGDESSDSPYSSEPYLDKSIWFSDDYEIEILAADQIKITESFEGGDGKRYYIVMYFSKVDFIPYDRTNEELQAIFRDKMTGFFSDPIYSQVDVTDLTSFLLAFIEDGKRHGRDMSWIVPSNYNFEFDSSVFTLGIDYHLLNCEGGGRTVEATFRVNKKWWDKMAFVDQRNLHIQIFWEVFANSLFTYDYFEEEGHLLSYGGAGLMTFDNSEEKFNFQEATKKMFQGIGQRSWHSCDSKTENSLNTLSKQYPFKFKKRRK